MRLTRRLLTPWALPLVTLACLLFSQEAEGAVGVRLKDLARIREVRDNQLHGIGLVVGLDGSGDGGDLAKQLAKNMLEKENITIPADDLNSDNIAAVIVTAEPAPFLSEGSRLDVLVSCIGAATSLGGGTLIQTPLLGVDGVIYAVAQGPVSTGGFAVAGAAANVTKNHPTVARIPDGAILEQRIPTILRPGDDIHLVLDQPDFTTAVRAAKGINDLFPDMAKPMDAGLIQVRVPNDYRSVDRLAVFISLVHEVQVIPDIAAVVVVNERTGTIVAGEHVKLNTVAISHGSITISITETSDTKMPEPFTRADPATDVSTEINVEEPRPGIYVVQDAATLAEVARALNLLGVTPREMVSIFQALKQAGALQGELRII